MARTRSPARGRPAVLARPSREPGTTPDPGRALSSRGAGSARSGARPVRHTHSRCGDLPSTLHDALSSERKRRAALAEAEARGESFWTDQLDGAARGKLVDAVLQLQ